MICANVFTAVQLVVSAVGSLVGGGLTVAAYNAKQASRARLVDHLSAQLEHLYAPLHFFVSQNKVCFDRARKISQAGHEVYTGHGPQYDDDIDATIDGEKRYYEVVAKNNREIMDVLRSNYSYIDLADLDAFNEFAVHYTRLAVECDNSAKGRIPLVVSLKLGDISMCPAEFVDRVEARYREKKELHDCLQLRRK